MLRANFFTKLSLSITALAVMVSLWPTLPAQAATLQPSNNYVIKLHDSDINLLQSVADNIERKFDFSVSPQFQNVYGFHSNQSLETLRQELVGSYDYLELDQSIVAGAITKPNDPGFTTRANDVDRQWALAKAGFIEAWKKTTGSTNTVVAVIDTGVDQTHKDLADSTFAKGIDLATGLPIDRGTNSDPNGHGTLITGVIAAKPNNKTGIAGTNWRVTILPIKALNSNGSGKSSDIAEGIVWAADHAADIINMSLGGLGFGHDTTLAEAVSYAYRKNVLIVSAAGNDVAVTGGNLDISPVFPICDDNGENMILGVTATDVNDKKPSFANFGKSCIDVSAPGRRILSTTNHDPSTGVALPNAYAYASGTSLAVPYVVGQAALLKSLFPASSNKQIRDRIISTSKNIDDLNPIECNGPCAGLLGSGRIDVAQSVADPIGATRLKEGDVVQIKETGALYYISGSKRHPISNFVKNQRFAQANIRSVNLSDLEEFPEGSYAEPLDGTLLKSPNDPTVFYMDKGLRLPVTAQVFHLRSFNFSEVQTLGISEVNSWLVGSLLVPPEGSLVRTAGNPTVYWSVSGVMHPISHGFYLLRGLQIFPVVYVSDNDLKNFPKGDPYTD